VLAASSLVFALGLAGIGAAPNLPVYLFAWAVVGLGMGSGLYDAVFAALGKLFGQAARAPITNLTLFGGFASTVCWPLSAFLVESMGWRATCLVYAALHLLVALPLQLAAMRAPASREQAPAQAAADVAVAEAASVHAHERAILLLLALILSIASGIGSIVVVHLLILLQDRGLDFAAAVALGTLFGPAQVGARVVESLFGRRYHPVWTLVGSVSLMAVGLLLLLASSIPPALAVVLYAAGYGISWIARGTLPLALFGPVRYPHLMGRIAMPSLVVQALAPAAGALILARYGSTVTIVVLAAFALLNVALMLALRARIAPQRSAT
jgi:predicted MFS family arabinose efflux permease